MSPERYSWLRKRCTIRMVWQLASSKRGLSHIQILHHQKLFIFLPKILPQDDISMLQRKKHEKKNSNNRFSFERCFFRLPIKQHLYQFLVFLLYSYLIVIYLRNKTKHDALNFRFVAFQKSRLLVSCGSLFS